LIVECQCRQYPHCCFVQCLPNAGRKRIITTWLSLWGRCILARYAPAAPNACTRLPNLLVSVYGCRFIFLMRTRILCAHALGGGWQGRMSFRAAKPQACVHTKSSSMVLTRDTPQRNKPLPSFSSSSTSSSCSSTTNREMKVHKG
jgi:hypothetical protein